MPALTAGIPIGTIPAPKNILTSVLVAVIGPYPMEYYGTTTEKSLLEMCASTPDVEANIFYVPDMVTAEEKAMPRAEDPLTCDEPWSAGLRKMRETAIAQALTLGYDYVFVVENDAAVKSDTLTRLLKAPADIVCPRLDYITFPPVGRVCWGPQASLETTGYWPLKWCAHTAMLMNRNAMERVQPFWSDSCVEGIASKRWLDAGLSMLMDLDTRISWLR